MIVGGGGHGAPPPGDPKYGSNRAAGAVGAGVTYARGTLSPSQGVLGVRAR